MTSKSHFERNKDVATLLRTFECSLSKSVNSLRMLLLKKVGQKSTHREDALHTAAVVLEGRSQAGFQGSK